MPHRVGHLWERIGTLENVERAWLVYNRNRPRRLRREFDAARCRSIHERLCAIAEGGASDIFSKIRRRTIFEHGKERQLEIPTFDGFIAQQAVFNVLAPIIDSRLHGRTYSSRPGWGMHKCAKAQMRLVNTKPALARYFLYFDIRKFYQNVRHEDVERAVARIVKDERAMRVVRAILAATPSGLPIGFTGSHHFANLLVAPLYYLVRGVEKVSDCYVYMDNFIVYGRTKRSLHVAQGEAEACLAELGLEMKPDWQVAPLKARPVATCGVRIRRGETPKLYKKLNHRNFRNIDKFLAHPTRRLARGLVSRYGWLAAVGRERILSDAVSLDYVKGKAKR